MSSERKFVRENTNRVLIKEFLIKKIEGAGFGGMSIQRTPMGTRIDILVERPGMVIGKSGNKIKDLTDDIRANFNVDNPQIEIQEAGSKASLNAQIMAEKLAEALERGWHFRRAGHSTVRRIMDAGAKGCQVIIAGKLTGARHRTEKFTEGHIKYCGETAKEVMDVGYATAKLKPGVLGVKVRIMKPDAKLPDEITLKVVAEEKTKEVKKEEEKKEEPAEKKKTDIKRLTEIKGIGPSIIKKFEKAGITSLEELFEMDYDDLSSIDGIGGKTAENIIKNLKKLLGGTT
ncbi:MAG: 30S ribosomal protein S3 [Candidatus Thermoplasmatota archaeon]|jgi:small subunit ribosomal protein S3|nr:30S ribosomal protein S3 [Candidatus Thermoplasmatota archaeon]